MLCIGDFSFFQFIFNLFVMCFQSGNAGVLLGNIVQIKYKQNIKYKMQAKKRGAPVKKNATKLKPQKALNDNSDTINTTKEKTFATIEETFEFQDHKTSTRTTHYTSRRDCIDRMEANKLSPFSSPGQSLSPKHRKSLSPFVVKQKQIKKIKKVQPSDGINNTKKITSVHTKTVKSSKQKSKNAQKIKIAFENDFLKKLSHFNKKKITEVSDEMEDSIRKSKKLLLTAKRQATNKLKKNKLEIIRQIHMKVKQKYRRQYPNLKPSQLKILSAVVLIQRLWRQTKVKSMIGQFLSPRNLGTNKFYNNTFGQMHFKSENDQRNSNIIDLSHNQQTMKTEKSFPSLSPKSIKVKQDDVKNVQQLSSIQNGSQILFTPAKSTINLKELEVSDELSDVSSTKAKQILKYIDMYRQVTLKQKKEKKKKKLSKPNAFNFPESLSEKCLLQNLYKKRISNIKCLNEKVEISQLFLTSASMQKAKQMYVSPKKPQIVQLQQRFYTEAQDEQFPNIPAKQEKDQIKLEDQTVGSIGNVGSKIVQMLILQFSEQFQAFTSKKCLKKKKRLPGITINDLTIQTYLNQFVNHIKKQYCGHFENSFTKISANNFLKFLRVPPEQDIFEPGDEEQDEEQLNFPVLPCSAFFQFQPIYQQKIFSIKQEDKKYSNFLSGLIKIHNKCLADSFSDFIQKQRLESIEFPWDKICPAKSQKKIEEQIKQKMPQRIAEIQKRIVSLSSTRLGRLHKKDMQQEQINLLKSLKEDYKREGKDWSQHQQLLEVRLEITELITQQLIQELSTQMTLFITA